MLVANAATYSALTLEQNSSLLQHQVSTLGDRWHEVMNISMSKYDAYMSIIASISINVSVSVML